MIRRIARLELSDGRRVYAELAGGQASVLDAAPWLGGLPTGEQIPAIDAEGRGAGAQRLAPVEPTKIVCVGRNYRAHAAELGNAVPAEPLLFLKPPSSLLGPEGELELPPRRLSSQVEHEVELAIVIGSRVHRATAEQARAAIFGYTIVADITARDVQHQDKQWTRAKGMDGFCPTGPVVVSGLDPANLAIRCLVNGQVRQSGTTGDMVFTPEVIVAYVSDTMTLEPGDLLATGTPEGVGPLVHGDKLVLEIDGIGALPIRVVAR